ncbi:MAG: caspase family protein [Candidatus Protochlamydia sp.]|nr:caspase family protein [Candidatus Protochlamydia sp.]
MKKLFLYLFILCSLFTVSIEAASFHAILVGDSLNDHDPTGFEGGVDLWKREIKRIAAFTGLELKGFIFEEHHCRINEVISHIKEMEVESDDVIFIYFAIHGSRSENKKNRWPDLVFSLDRDKIDFSFINHLLKEKKPRLLLSIADSCNNIVRGNAGKDRHKLVDLIEGQTAEEIPTVSNTDSFRELAIHHATEELLEKYRSLFLEQSGTLLISTSSPGQFSIKHCLTGGIFTGQLIENLRKIQRNKTTSWESLLIEASRATRQKVEQIRKEMKLDAGQVPQFEINLSPSR